MNRRVVYTALAALVGTGVVALLIYAARPDTYYMGRDVSRWEHARGFNGWIVFAASIGLGVMSFVGLVARAAGAAARLDAAVRVLTLVALLSFPVAYVAVTTGH